MILCPKCQKLTNEIRFEGPVLIAEGVVELDDVAGHVVVVSPLRAVQTIKAGTELTAAGFFFVCPGCKYRAPREEFLLVSACIITGQATTFKLKTSVGMIPVLEEHAAEVARIFHSENARAEYLPVEEELAAYV
jgi:hypothetical protein